MGGPHLNGKWYVACHMVVCGQRLMEGNLFCCPKPQKPQEKTLLLCIFWREVEWCCSRCPGARRLPVHAGTFFAQLMMKRKASDVAGRPPSPHATRAPGGATWACGAVPGVQFEAAGVEEVRGEAQDEPHAEGQHPPSPAAAHCGGLRGLGPEGVDGGHGCAAGRRGRGGGRWGKADPALPLAKAGSSRRKRNHAAHRYGTCHNCVNCMKKTERNHGKHRGFVAISIRNLSAGLSLVSFNNNFEQNKSYDNNIMA